MNLVFNSAYTLMIYLFSPRLLYANNPFWVSKYF